MFSIKKFFFTASWMFLSTSLFSQDTTITTLSSVHQGNGSGLATRTVTDTFLFPHDISMYSQINLSISLNCPTGGCDPWDRFANVRIFHNGEWFEIARYITPYGRACGWITDVSDYRSMLKDTVILQSFIDTWTNPGWIVDLEFEFIGGTPAYQDIKVENLWVNYNAIYGDTTQPTILPVASPLIDLTADSVKIRLVNTGHGQGNTNNAAEFSQKTHHIFVDGISQYAQYLWRSNCGANPCSPQSGTWQYNRAGWCPGADVIPDVYDITPYITPGMTVNLDYQLQSFFNNCSPNNPGCVQGSTCPDCNYNYNGHTEPHYKISGQLITYESASTGMSMLNRNLRFTVYPNPSKGIFHIKVSNSSIAYAMEVLNPVGERVFALGMRSGPITIDLSDLPKGIYFLHISGDEVNKAEKLVIQ